MLLPPSGNGAPTSGGGLGAAPSEDATPGGGELDPAVAPHRRPMPATRVPVVPLAWRVREAEVQDARPGAGSAGGPRGEASHGGGGAWGAGFGDGRSTRMWWIELPLLWRHTAQI